MHWAAPANNGAAITRYVVTPYKNGVAQPARTFAANVTTRKITGLTTGQHYKFRVAATNARGTSPMSNPSGTVKIT